MKYAEETWVGCTGSYLRDAARFMKHHGGTIDLTGYSELETCDSDILLFSMSNIPFPDPLYSYSKLFNLFHIVVIYSEGKTLSWQSFSQSLESTYGSPTVRRVSVVFVYFGFILENRSKMICNNLDGMGFAHLFVPLGAYSDTTAQVPANAMKRPKSGYPTTEEADLHSSKPLWIQNQPSKSGTYPMIFKHISVLTGWAHSLAERHVNCRRIPVDLVLRMCIRMLRYVLPSNN